jgi:hypothetical protein
VELDNPKASKNFFTEGNFAESGAGLSVGTQSQWTVGRISTTALALVWLAATSFISYKYADEIFCVELNDNKGLVKLFFGMAATCTSYIAAQAMMG